MSIENRTEAAMKDIEGKAQAAAGEISGDSGDKIAGNAKQLEAVIAQKTDELLQKEVAYDEKIKELSNNIYLNISFMYLSLILLLILHIFILSY